MGIGSWTVCTSLRSFIYPPKSQWNHSWWVLNSLQPQKSILNPIYLRKNHPKHPIQPLLIPIKNPMTNHPKPRIDSIQAAVLSQPPERMMLGSSGWYLGPRIPRRCRCDSDAAKNRCWTWGKVRERHQTKSENSWGSYGKVQEISHLNKIDKKLSWLPRLIKPEF